MINKINDLIGQFTLLQGFGWLAWIAIYVAIAGWLVVALGYLHIHYATGFLRQIPFGTTLMDILDRLTNRAALEAMLAKSRTGQTKAVNQAHIAKFLKERVFGQNAVCESVAQQVYVRFAKSSRTRPVGVFLLAGPPATGKTHFGKKLSEALYGDNALVMFEMSQFAQGHAASALFGSSKGYAGSDTYGALTAKLKAKPDCVILLDEFEKASREVHARFLSAWNDGFVTETSTGEQVPTTDAIFILTTNAAQRDIAKLADQFRNDPEGYSEACKRLLTDQHFAPEVLSRIDFIFPFLPLQGIDVARVVLSLIESNVKEFDMELTQVEPSVIGPTVEKTAQKGDDPRKIARTIEKLIGPQLAALKSDGVQKVSLIDEGGMVRVVAV